MTIVDRHPGLRWVAPAAAVAVIIGGTLVGTVAASAGPGLPAKTAAELLVDLQGAKPVAMSGTVESRADLGLPALPAMGPQGSDLTSLVSGTHTLRMWTDGAERGRLDLMSREQETDVYRTGRDVWVWSSGDRTAEHLVLPSPPTDAAMPDTSGLPDGMSLPRTPQEAADMVLAALDQSTTVTSSGVAKVAGRPVYELVLTPKQDATLVAKVAIAIDAETSTPLRVQAYSRQLQEPAFEVGFTSVDFGPVDDEVFTFTPPPGATVTDHALEAPAPDAAKPDGQRPTPAKPTVVGSGWEIVVVAKRPPMPDPAAANDAASPSGGPSAAAMLDLLPTTSGPWGTGRVLAGTLFSVILTDDGTIAVGAVPPAALESALAAS